LQPSAERAAQTFDVRILLFSKKRQLIWDTNSGKDPALNFPVKRVLLSKLPLVRDATGAAWLYSLQKMPDNTFLVIAAPRPRFSLWNLFTGDLIPNFLQSGLIALLL